MALTSYEVLAKLGLKIGDVIAMPYHDGDFYERMMQPPPTIHRVYYAGGRHHHVPPDHFFFAPFDAVWIVPGTES